MIRITLLIPIFIGLFGIMAMLGVAAIRLAQLENMACMDKALAACEQACDNDRSAPHQVGRGEERGTYVDCYCQGYKQYDYHPSGQ